jgi:hypothetical protein
MRNAVDQDAQQTLVGTGSMWEFRAVSKGEGWSIWGRIGASWLSVRIWASLTAGGASAKLRAPAR